MKETIAVGETLPKASVQSERRIFGVELGSREHDTASFYFRVVDVGLLMLYRRAKD